VRFGPFRAVSRFTAAMALVLVGAALLVGAAQVVDGLLGWDLAGTLGLHVWVQPLFGFVGGIGWLAASMVVATSSLESVEVETPDGAFEGAFEGESPGLRRVARMGGAVACALVGVYAILVGVDAVLGTTYAALYQSLADAIRTFDTVEGAWGEYGDWATFVVTVLVMAGVLGSQERWGCLGTWLAATLVWLTWAWTSGALADFGGPFRAALASVFAWFQ